MAGEETAKASALIAQLRVKMRKLADEFARGDINREQFHKIYEHYQSQLNLAASTLAQMGDQKVENIQSGETIMLRKQLTAIARAAVVYHHASGEMIETIGELGFPVDTLLPTLTAIAEQVKGGEGHPTKFAPRGDTGAPLPESQIVTVGKDWALFVPGEFSTAVMIFSNEPVIRQIEIVENMHRDFEIANDAALRSGQTQAAKLVYPFLAFVRRSVKRPGS